MGKVVLFGAGASAGSCDVDPDLPSLGYELYNKLKSKFPKTWGKLSPRYDQYLTNNFEYGMNIVYISPYSFEEVVIEDIYILYTVYFCQFRPSI